MAKKRKQSQQAAGAPLPVVEAEPPRKRTLLGLVPASNGNGTTAPEENPKSDTPVAFRNKEKTLVLCSRRITFRCVSLLWLPGIVSFCLISRAWQEHGKHVSSSNFRCRSVARVSG